MAAVDRRARRAVEAHRLERRALRFTLLFVVAASLVVVVPGVDPRWSAIHLFAVGGLLSAIAGTTQLLAVTWGTAPAPPRWLSAAQRWTIGVGAAAITVGMAWDAPLLTGLGGGTVGTGLVAVAASLVSIRRTAAVDRFTPALDGYLVALCFGVAGVGLGVALATGSHGPGLRGAHLGVNLLGLVGIVIASTLPFFTATQLRTRMSPRASPGHLRLLTAWLAAATLVVAWGAQAQPAAWRWGVLAWAVGVAALATMLPWPGRRQLDFAGPRAVQLAAGSVWWVVALLALAGTDPFAVLGSRWLPVLLIGGYGQLLLASVAYLAPVVRGGGHEQLSAAFRTTGSWLAVVTVNLAALGAVARAWTVAVALAGVAAVDTAVRATLVTRATR